jgi:hypothetical protein
MGNIPDFENGRRDSAENLDKRNPNEKNSNQTVDLDCLPQSTIMSVEQDDWKTDGIDQANGIALKRSKFHSTKPGHASQMATSWTQEKANTLGESAHEPDIEEEDDYENLSN